MSASNDDREESAAALASPPRDRKRRLFPRFGLRSLLIVGLVFSLGFGWIGKNLYRARQEDAAIETLKRAGATILVTTERGQEVHPATPHPGHFAVAAESPSLTARALGFAGEAPATTVIFPPTDTGGLLPHGSSQPREDAVAALAKLPRLESLEFVGPAFDDAALERLPALPHVTSVMFTRTAITGEGVAKLKKLPSLRRVAAGQLDVRFGFVPGLSTLTELREIHLYVQDLSRADFAALAVLPRLEKLDLTYVTLQGSAVLDPLAESTSIEEFHLAEAPASGPLTAADLESILKLPKLRILTLGDASGLLEEEIEADSLQLVQLYGETVDEPAVRAFSAKHPDCLVAIASPGRSAYFLAGVEIDRSAGVEKEETIVRK